MGNTGCEEVLTSWGKRRCHVVRGVSTESALAAGVQDPSGCSGP